MRKLMYEIDDNGFIVEVHVVEAGEVTDYVSVRPPHGLYRAKWTGVEWVEDMSQEEIDDLNNIIQEPSEKERIEMLENMLLMIMEG